MSSETISALETAVEAFLIQERDLTPATIRLWIDRFRGMPMLAVSDDEAEHLARRLEARHDVSMAIGSVLVEREYKPWLEAALSQIQFYYWERYRRLLEHKRFSQQVVSTIHNETERVLGLLENPTKPGPWARRGMVVGHVQSGKTANYLGLLTKAADAGYRLIIVIAGVHNNLRNQTQKRLDEGFVGRDSARLLAQREERYVGVGQIDGRRRPVTFTNSVKDFSKEMATGVGVPLQNLNEPAVFVIKKHPRTLENLVEWLEEHNASRGGTSVDLPMLLIDDEADNASINVGYDKGSVSTINGMIRKLLKLFSRSCYVGYTATPFANIFIDPDSDDEMLGADLFPRHFIVSLEPPTNYFGPDVVFRSKDGRTVKHIDDSEDLLPLTHKKELRLAGLPQSLHTAIRAFLVGRAIRLLRGQLTSHCSMLVNVSRFTDVQGQVRGLVQQTIEGLQASVRVNGALPTAVALKDPGIASLHAVWRDEYEGAAPKWSSVQGVLLEAVAPVRVVEVNNRSHGTLNYGDYEESGLSVIAIGGLSLSRGLTLEGLTVSYFLRNSMMYDTLMQMGRWFGYRPDYGDLCRVWLPEEAEGWYVHIAESIDLLRDEFRRMASAGATPEEFGLKVRAHPDTLIVTARNKMGSGERIVTNVGLNNHFVETATLRNDAESLHANREALKVFVDALEDIGKGPSLGETVTGGILIRGVPVLPIEQFLGVFQNHESALLTDPVPLVRYIRRRAATELATWDILLAGVQNREETSLCGHSYGIPITCQLRSAGNRSDSYTLRVTNKQRVASRGVEKVGLTDAQAAEAEKDYLALRKSSPGTNTDEANFPDYIYRRKRNRGFLIVHLLDIRTKDDRTVRLHSLPVVAWSIGFPETAIPEERVEYVVTTTWMKENSREDLEDDHDDDE